jgi:hypothetical protein
MKVPRTEGGTGWLGIAGSYTPDVLRVVTGSTDHRRPQRRESRYLQVGVSIQKNSHDTTSKINPGLLFSHLNGNRETAIREKRGVVDVMEPLPESSLSS